MHGIIKNIQKQIDNINVIIKNQEEFFGKNIINNNFDISQLGIFQSKVPLMEITYNCNHNLDQLRNAIKDIQMNITNLQTSLENDIINKIKKELKIITSILDKE